MKNFFRLLFFVLLTCATPIMSMAQGNNPVGQINQAFRTGDVGGIVRYMDNVVSVTMNNNQATSSRTQAEMMLRDFFSKNEPKSFEAGHTGENNQTNSVFSIGHLNTSTGRYRVYILLKQQGQNYLLQEIRIEK